MKKNRILAAICCLVLLINCLSLPTFAETAQKAAQTEEASEPPAPAERRPSEEFSVAAKAALLVDLGTDHVIYEQNIDDLVYPASLTKIMTCLLVLENGNLSDIVTVEEDAYQDVSESGSTAGLIVGEQLTVEQLLYCMMIVSGNEACNVAAKYIAGSVPAFVDMMNERAQQLGCTGTHFANCHGLHDPDHYTTVRDLKLITEAALKSEKFKTITNTASYTLPATNKSEPRELRTTNQLIFNNTANGYYYSKAAGIKTGFTSQAGRCLISTAKDKGLYLLAIICGAETQLIESGEVSQQSFPQCIRLFEYGFQNFSYVTVLTPLYPLTQIGVRYSAGSEYVALAPKEEVKTLLSVSYDPDKLKTDYTLTESAAIAPVTAGDVYGHATVTYDGQIVGETDLVAIADVARSDLSAAASETKTYIQTSWWKWIVIAIILFLAVVIVRVALRSYRKKKARREMIEKRRQMIENQKNDIF